MKKTTLCVDLGNVLIRFDATSTKSLLKDGVLEDFLSCCLQFDRGNINLTEMLREANEQYFSHHVPRTDFIAVLAQSIREINQPMFYEILRFKERGRGELKMITDNNPFCFEMTVLKFPQVFELFRDNEKENWIVSWEKKSLKRDVTLFHRAFSDLGFSPKEAVFVDDLPINIESAKKAGFCASACFLYKLDDQKNQRQFEKFLNKHFPPK
ncbi:hypothetical protein A3G55_04235 [Candidatus Giovannonibacteria bacterium RIFCSPLOWO2_12_FULL_44_25]|uniref:HAD-superfamily hydrolase, subfamily IA, variant 3 n=3 Tax=Parcubacteria group TaxID=1794811 RepID=A0A837IJ83_9BACT|nr:MAG: hypothetical protein UW15_C0002G0015 [Parcubacteria group bacterium GW2011_GWC1_44_10]KKT59930.1 MAG: hypothetical protein UW53_C0005G0013 [Candidatus Giovannonibacteria bacterium GW2011_GWA1_44_25]KKU12926.1 MAG: hypothetical protein UX18_C0006G0010 [Candidatus Azambacteria bacterium GW2011_GWC2_45_7b]KKU29755.1 MAG: hypothetical protein UX43_C0006G0030 [Candidatus Giovannonibacteria bacterium GW2011_GWB1_46_20]OGF49139.1 MAG: hypothetical protein A2120_01615 [Candidatus Giovannonibact